MVFSILDVSHIVSQQSRVAIAKAATASRGARRTNGNHLIEQMQARCGRTTIDMSQIYARLGAIYARVAVPPPSALSDQDVLEMFLDRAVVHTRAILRDLFGPPEERSFSVRLWDGSVEEAGGSGEPIFTLVLRFPYALRRMLWPPSELSLGEAYLRGEFDIEGNVEAAICLGDVLHAQPRSPRVMARLITHIVALPPNAQKAELGRRVQTPLRRLGARHSRQRDAATVKAHYDVSNDFYQLWLDHRLVYSCAYFQTGSESLNAAQEAKLEHICRKLRLQPGERLLDIGCGWGGLVHYAAERYGVHATGITLSESQADFARERIHAAGLDARATIELWDYRDIPSNLQFDKVVSVGMLEHVGRAKLTTYFEKARQLTVPGGLFLAHGIVHLTRPPNPVVSTLAGRLIWRRGAFVQRYVFPDGELAPPAELVRHAERAGWELRDVENLREHYARTLRHWVDRLEANHDDATQLVGEVTYRISRLHMAGSARAFANGNLGVVQLLLSNTDTHGTCRLPPTRADIYRERVTTMPAPDTIAVE